MKRRALVLLCAVACNDPPAPVVGATGSDTGDSTGATTLAPTTTAPTSSGADGTSTGVAPTIVLDMTLDLELNETIRVTVSEVGEAIEIAIDPSRGYGIAAGTLVGAGRIDAYPEVEATMYVATFEGEPVADGPCGDAPVSLALALHHDHDANVIAGGLTGYCGAATFFGVPAIEPLRISGRLP